MSDNVLHPLHMHAGIFADPGPQPSKLILRLLLDLNVNTTCVASNVSFGLPNRKGLNSTFISMAIGAGMTSAITNPMVDELMQAVRGADVLMNHDPQCGNWISAYREPQKNGGRPTRRRRRSAQA